MSKSAVLNISGLMVQVALQIFSATAGFPLTAQRVLLSLWVFHFSLPGERNPVLSNPRAKKNMHLCLS